MVHFLNSRTVSRSLAMPICNVSNSQNICKYTFNKCSGIMIILYRMLFPLSQTSTLLWKVDTTLWWPTSKRKHPYIFDIGCSCHLSNLCTVAAVKTLPMPIEDLLVDTFFHFYYSSSRKEKYIEFTKFCDVEPTKILKHCSTHWLSLEKCVKWSAS